jgi:hypothetical protein
MVIGSNRLEAEVQIFRLQTFKVYEGVARTRRLQRY